MDTASVVRALRSTVGITLTQAMVGVPDRSRVESWAAGTGETPTASEAARIRLGHALWLNVAAHEGASTALSWLVGSNPWLGDATPVTAIREGREAEVVQAVHALVDDRGGS